MNLQTSTHPRSTFIEARQILERTRGFARGGRERLARELQRSEQDSRTQILLDTVEEQRLALEQAIDQCVETVSENALQTRAQYTIDLWEGKPSLPPDHSLDAAVQWLLELDRRLVETYRALADRSTNQELARLFASLVELIEAHDRRLSREVQSIYDL
jgi:rubrerythrin